MRGTKDWWYQMWYSDNDFRALSDFLKKVPSNIVSQSKEAGKFDQDGTYEQWHKPKPDRIYS